MRLPPGTGEVETKNITSLGERSGKAGQRR